MGEDSMVEIVKAAIKAKAHELDPFFGGMLYDREAEALARAAIEAMREPTEVMLQAAYLADLSGTGLATDKPYPHNRRRWTAMITAALKDPTHG